MKGGDMKKIMLIILLLFSSTTLVADEGYESERRDSKAGEYHCSNMIIIQYAIPMYNIFFIVRSLWEQPNGRLKTVDEDCKN
jgi:hypothetical protein